MSVQSVLLRQEPDTIAIRQKPAGTIRTLVYRTIAHSQMPTATESATTAVHKTAKTPVRHIPQITAQKTPVQITIPAQALTMVTGTAAAEDNSGK